MHDTGDDSVINGNCTSPSRNNDDIEISGYINITKWIISYVLVGYYHILLLLHIQHRTNNSDQQSGYKWSVLTIDDQNDNQTPRIDGSLLSYDKFLKV